jgi:site-specific DNA-methyltransferase (adenine-specific)
MKPYFDDGHGITIYHGDCLDVVAQIERGAVDAVLTDPPFSSGARTDAGKTTRGAMLRGSKWDADWFSHDNMATHGFLFLMRLLGSELLRVVRVGGTGHFFIDWRMYPNLYGALESSGWQVKNLLVWDKHHFGMGTNYRNQHELIIYAERGTADFHDHGIGNVLRAKRPGTENHPTEKPTDLIGSMLRAVTLPGAVVLDPFMGSGSTLVAAKQCGRNAIGIEIEERYCEIAAERLSQSVMPFVAGDESEAEPTRSGGLFSEGAL